MTSEESGELYTRFAFQYESALDRLIGKGLIAKDFADKHKKAFYDSLDEEKLQTSQKIRSHTEIMRRYVRSMIFGDMVSLTKITKQYCSEER